MPCRIDKREEWTARMQFERAMHADAVFTTLTYAPEYLPADGSVNKQDPQRFLKRLRSNLARSERPKTFRYYLSAEYGDPAKFTGRAHYHAIFFGLSSLDGKEIHDSWAMGRTETLPCTPGRIRYVAAYVQKKLIKAGEEFHPDGRRSEFALMSRRPGLGQGFLSAVADGLARVETTEGINLRGSIRMDGRKFFIDRYGRNLLVSRLVDLGRSRSDAESLVRSIARETPPDREAISVLAFEKAEQALDA